MSRETHAEMLIKTLEALRKAESERETARLRHQCKEHAARFIKAFRPELDNSGRLSDWIPRSTQTAQGAVQPAQDELSLHSLHDQQK